MIIYSHNWLSYSFKVIVVRHMTRAGSGAGASRAIAQGPKEREGPIMFLSIQKKKFVN